MPRVISAVIFTILLAATTMFLAILGLQPALAQSPTTIESQSLIWPLSGTSTPDTASSPFGPRWQASHSRYDYHPGMDLPAPQNTPVHVITDGVVSEVGWLSTSSGLAVVVYHPTMNLYSAYLHLNSTAVAVNDTVTQGQVIGAVGNTGTTEFMHLHFEIRLTASNYPTSTRNPMDYLPRTDVTTPTIRIGWLNSDPIYSPTVSLVITAARTELDVNAITVTLRDRTTGAVLDEKLVDFNQRTPTGADTLIANGVELQPSHFSTTTVEYELTANFTLNGTDAATLTAEVADLAGHTASVTQGVNDTTPPAPIDSLTAMWRTDGGVDLRWTAPGDSGMVGTATQYDILYSGSPIDIWSLPTSLSTIASPPAPQIGGTVQTFTVTGPLPNPVYFAIKTRDNEGNISQLSNSAPAQTAWRIFLPLVIK